MTGGYQPPAFSCNFAMLCYDGERMSREDVYAIFVSCDIEQQRHIGYYAP